MDGYEDRTAQRQLLQPTLTEVIAARISRRKLMRGALATAAVAATVSPMALLAGCSDPETAADAGANAATADDGRISFQELEHGVDANIHVAEGYDADVLIRWGDAVLPGAPAFDPANQNGAAQALQFGYNNDYIGYIPLPFGSGSSDHGLLCVNHEFVSLEVMFPTLFTMNKKRELVPTAAAAAHSEEELARIIKERSDVVIAAHGGSIIEVRKTEGQWGVVENSAYARRITASTPMRIAGPAAGHPWLRTKEDPAGTQVLGTLNNCAGGITPWGTYLMAEENVHLYFGTALPADDPRTENYARYNLPFSRVWTLQEERFDTLLEPNEPNRFGWVVEVDPLDPTSTPVKRTAMGRFFHEGAESIVNKDGRIVVYMGDDARFEYLYRYVSQGTVDPDNRSANTSLLDVGTLSVARFNDDGSLTWLPLVYGDNGLDPSNGFTSQAQVLIETRRAADLLGATPMDRPEDVEPNKVTGKVYVMLTNNKLRGSEDHPDADAANPRDNNRAGHIVELTPLNGDHGADTATWDILVQCGDPARDGIDALWNPATSAQGWFNSPDNAATDPAGNLWIATDQGGAWPHNSGLPDPDLTEGATPDGITADGIWSLGTEGDERGLGRMFFRAPVGAEVCGPKFTPDGETLFLAIQHPGDRSGAKWVGHDRPSTFEDPATRWPDFEDGMPPRPSVVVVTKQGGGRIGS
ncbi:MAG: PhoX family protein [Alphaproteobacteria bacterium]